MFTDTRDQTARDRAVTQLKKRRDFRGHLLVYALVNTFLVAIWAVVDAHGFFWPVFPIVGWGIGVVMNAWMSTGDRGSPSKTSSARSSARTSRSERGGTSAGGSCAAW